MNNRHRSFTQIFKSLPALFFEPVEIASIVYFRIAFGGIMLWEMWRYFSHHWIERYYIAPSLYFTYYGFDWVKPWPGDLMYLHFYALVALAFFILIGLWYRISAVLFFLGFTYVFLLDQAQHLNHFYLICLVSFLMIFIPANQPFSIDSWGSKKRTTTAPAWALWALRLQIGIAYFYGGVAKLNSDWLHGEPMRMWLASSSFPVIGQFFTQEWMVFLFSYGGLLLDLSIVPFLLWQKTRPFAFGAAILFHLMNATLFKIGIFPWFMIAATLLFFPPNWPVRLIQLFGLKKDQSAHQNFENTKAPLTVSQKVSIVLFCVYFAVQLLLPLRHHLYPGNVNWTEEGHRFSWHMKLRSKSGALRLYAKDLDSQKTWEVNPSEYLTKRQLGEMNTQPDMILQLCQHIAEELRRQGYENVEVRAYALVSLNGRKPQLLIDPKVNLAAQPRSLLPATWIMPLTEPLKTRTETR